MHKLLLIAITALLTIPVLLSAEDNEMLKTGTPAPDFSLASHQGGTVSLKDFRDKQYVVLVFYPGDNTPVCTKQLCEIRDDYSRFGERNAVVLGINHGSAESHIKFAKKWNYPFPLLVDTDKKVINAYGCKGLFMPKRTVYVIDPSGVIVYAERGKPPVEEILKAIPAAGQ